MLTSKDNANPEYVTSYDAKSSNVLVQDRLKEDDTQNTMMKQVFFQKQSTRIDVCFKSQSWDILGDGFQVFLCMIYTQTVQDSPNPAPRPLKSFTADRTSSPTHSCA